LEPDQHNVGVVKGRNGAGELFGAGTVGLANEAGKVHRKS
jgi:hypothetical protein